MNDLEYFQQLKSALLKQYKAEHPHFEGMLSDFKGREIINFQQMLMEKVQGRISEKWFYTHLKVNRNEKLPRQDMLDLLSRFTGFQHWDDFKKEHQPNRPETTETTIEQPFQKQNKKWYFLTGLALLGLAFFIIKMIPANQQYQMEFCFVNDFSQEKIKANDLKIYWLKAEETPQELNLNKNGCLNITTKTASIALSIEGPYFQNQKINRKTSINHKETIRVQPDEYSTLVSYFVNADVAAWKEKRAQLEAIFAHNAMIIQLAPDGKTGIELYNKEEFVDKLTMPLKTIQNITIVAQKRNTNNQIISLKFLQQ